MVGKTSLAFFFFFYQNMHNLDSFACPFPGKFFCSSGVTALQASRPPVWSDMVFPETVVPTRVSHDALARPGQYRLVSLHPTVQVRTTQLAWPPASVCQVPSCPRRSPETQHPISLSEPPSHVPGTDTPRKRLRKVSHNRYLDSRTCSCFPTITTHGSARFRT